MLYKGRLKSFESYGFLGFGVQQWVLGFELQGFMAWCVPSDCIAEELAEVAAMIAGTMWSACILD